MKNILFVSDLDNTLLFSLRKSRPGEICIEKKDEKKQGFMTGFTYNSLKIINDITNFVPVTARSISQYRRIQWNDMQSPEYAIVSNGGILIKNGNIDINWLKTSQELVEPFKNEMWNLYNIFNSTKKCKVTRIVDGMYFYVHCYDEAQAVDCITQYKTVSQFEVVSHGKKVYFFPPVINKGNAVERLKAYIPYEKIVAAGDSIVDLPMLQKADLAIIPKELKNTEWNNYNIVKMCDEEKFSDYVCKQILKMCCYGTI